MKSESDARQSIYLIAVCGTGMASLAGLLKKAGHRVLGSDANIYPPMSTLLEQMGIEIRPGYKADNITGDIDLVVVGNAVSKDNAEVLAVQQAGIPYISFPQALARFFLEGRTSLVVTGTHGKTTTTALLAWVFEAVGRKPGFMVGGWHKNFDSNHQVPQGDFFITEGDEYDTAFFDKGPKFLHYRPHGAILTGIEFDHADIYRDLDHIKDAFRRFVETVDPEGFLLVECADGNIKDVLEGARCKVETYGFSKDADWHIASFACTDGVSEFDLHHQGRYIARFSLPMIGRHNVLNCAAVIAVARNSGISVEEIASALPYFKGIKRRQEVVGEADGVVVIDDFAHHPTAIDLTLEAVKEAWPERTLWAVFEPRSATSKRNVFQSRFPDSFLKADRTVIAAVPAPEKIKDDERLDPAAIAEALKARGKEAWHIESVAGIVDHIAQHHTSNDVVLVMSSGGFDGIHQKLLDRLGAQ
ncbi:UDP-N-acetylmuramate:L-alanyl-gamma-D-glutamyl-meso-diaminopimelate ligase [Nitrospina gracilis 3/211]|uniref:UDP-N-acetylmuramate:L-alanyl-gamma-D-glutamyl-meso-diaminopimelate ligase n=1 Tax=Nitrospina gracilis (strain 3/211) TaxID=1266370 RepID=M1YN11_NITG3|nr:MULTISPECIES: UDP-N-acetylmuramate:L-alanyl-gamma-D-glutamyl-meso-diaminopimelate ligase [Nitrospina]MCF8722456.1 UDP-N-acetylmuramate: L-alanyl-gamma-D-glutamyl-meso-diaminopimelate ligase [Nitrospina sp. Nb-3]CCQ91882.1 UDP-N-acetylmuramate:L-alanyl-gamma-D-glutamyl-meso-diaminopimelate ligase [Nitrospina gracilis 3/211]